MSHQREGKLNGSESSYLSHVFEEAVSWRAGYPLIVAFTIQFSGAAHVCLTAPPPLSLDM